MNIKCVLLKELGTIKKAYKRDTLAHLLLVRQWGYSLLVGSQVLSEKEVGPRFTAPLIT